MTNKHPDSAVAIIGMGCRLPGANNLEQFWDLLRAGKTAWGPVPEDRFSRRHFFHPERGTRNKSYSELAALVDYQPIDRTACPLSDRALAAHDRAHLTLCEVAAAACRHAGFDPAALPYDNTGVYVGHAADSGVGSESTFSIYIAETAKYLREAVGFDQLAAGLGDQTIADLIDRTRRLNARLDSEESLSLGASHAARLIADTFGLSGPCMSFNAACASSSRALVQAIRALQLGRIDMALVGGASHFHSDTMVLFAQSHSLTAQGSWPFTDKADGLVVGEGYVTLVLKLLSRAVADNDRILAIVPSVGGSSDGHGKSLWAPRFEGQVKAIQRAYGPEVLISQLQYVEAHATSTALGDVTEMKSLATVLEGQLPPGTKLAVGSAKWNVGHTLECAGLVGVLKTVLALEHQEIPPAVGEGTLSSDIDWDNLPLYPPRQSLAWTRSADGVPRRAGVNAFGIGGLNVHIVVDEFVPSAATQVRGARFSPSTDAAPRVRNEDDGIAIIGMGAVMPGALAREALWELLASGRDARIEVPSGRWDTEPFCRPDTPPQWQVASTRGGYVTGFHYDWRKHKIPPKQIQQASPLQFMILDAVDQAFQHAGYHQRTFDRQQVGVVVGTVFGGEYAAKLVMGLRLPVVQELLAELLASRGVSPELASSITENYAEVLLKRMPALLDETGSFTASALASRITKSFDLMGGAVAVDASQASSMAALSCCVDQLRSGDCEMMICVGAQNDMSPMLYLDWTIEGRLAGSSGPAPLDLRADGVLPGEGCGALLLKRLADARRDNDPIHAIIRGIGVARDVTPAAAASRAVQRALQDAAIDPNEVSLLELSPTGIAQRDAAELQGVAAAYASRSASEPILLGTPVGQFGDLFGASGMASLLKAAWEVERAEMPAVVSFEQPAAYVTRHRTILAVPREPSAITINNSDGRLIAGVHSGGLREDSYHVYLERGTRLTPTKQALCSPALSSAPEQHQEAAVAHQIIHFDATSRRRLRMRQNAGVLPSAQRESQNGDTADHVVVPPAPVKAAPITASPAPAPKPPAQPAPAPVRAAAPAKPSTNGAAAAKVAPAPAAAAPVTPKQPAPPPVVSATPPAHANNGASGEKLNAAELEKFLVNFVVEQTGYPAEIVELDADLEADLGIDSIKKAQLFGELGEYFDVQAAEGVSLDDFRTLRHVLDYLLENQAATAAPVAPPAPRPAVATAAPAPMAPVAATPPAPAPAAPASPTQPAATKPTSPTNGHAHAAATNGSNGAATEKLNAQELEAFLVNFVVEQTGYPPEIVELDADLEADLGIDSIKKAQLFGELGEYFEVHASEDLSLDDFRTLRHVLEFLLKSQAVAATSRQ